MKNLIATFLIIIICNKLYAQSDSFYVVQQNNANLVNIVLNKKSTLTEVANKYNISSEILGLFNPYTSNEVILEKSVIQIPLTETNFSKSASVYSYSGYQPVYYKALENETVLNVSKKFLVAEGALYKWNKFETQKLNPNQIIKIGWLKISDSKTNTINNPTVKNSTVSNPTVAINNTIDNPIVSNSSLKDDLNKSFSKAKIGVTNTVNKIGKNLKSISKPKLSAEQQAEINVDKRLKASNQTTQMEQDSTISFNKNEPLVKTTNKKIKIKENFNKGITNAKVAMGTGLEKVGGLINSGVKKIGLDKINMNQKITSDKPKKTIAIKEKKKEITIDTPAIEIAKPTVADVEIVNKDIIQKEIPKAEKNIEEIPTLQSENKEGSIYNLANNDPKIEEKTEEKTIEVKPIETKPVVKNVSKKINPKSGKAITFYSGGQGIHLAYTDYAPKGSKLLIENKKNGKKIEATVLGPLNKNKSDDEDGIFILLSDTVKKDLAPNGENFIVEVSLLK